MVVFSPPLPDHAQVGDPGHISDHNALLEAVKALNSGKIDYSHHTAKGTLVSASAANVPGTLTVGTDEMVLLADSSQTLGLKWAQLPTGGITDSAVTTAKIADGSVTTAKIANDAVTTAKIAADAVGASEIAAAAVTTAKIADSAVTAAKIGALTTKGDLLARDGSGAVRLPVGTDGQVLVADAAASAGVGWGAEPAVKATVGNLLTANQASIETDATGWASVGGRNSVLTRSSTYAVHGTYSLRAECAAGKTDVAIGVNTTGNKVTLPATGAGFVRLSFDARASAGTPGVRFSWTITDAGGSTLSSGSGNDLNLSGGYVTLSTSAWATLTLTLALPSNAAFVVYTVYSDATMTPGDYIYFDRFGAWLGVGGQWQLPGVPIPGQSRIAVNNAVDLSGTGTPEGVVTAAPGSTWLQTDATTDVKGWIRWIKASGTGSTGWVAGPEADTGRRDVSASLLNGWTTTSAIYMRRVGNRCHVYGSIRNASGAATSNTFIGRPTGFTTQTTALAAWAYNSSTDMASHAIRGGAVDWTVLGTRPSDQNLIFEIVYVTEAAWPSSLPGSAAA